MDLTYPKIIKELLSKYETRPSKGLGQNFLIDKNVLEKIIKVSEIKKTDTVLEVGPGMGVLTQKLAEKARRIVAVEKDETMIEVLKETVNDFNNIEVISEDILQIDLAQYTKKPYKVIANIPYYLTSPLIRKFLESKNQPEEMVLMLQKEVAQRICSKPPEMSLLAVSVQYYAKAKIEFYVSKNCFWPAPKIDSAIIKITPNRKFDKIESDSFFEIVKAGFSHPRKQLIGNLSKKLKLNKQQTGKWLEDNGIGSNQRAETLGIIDWTNLTKSFGKLELDQMGD